MNPSKMSHQEAITLINNLKKIFYIVRLVDVSMCQQYSVHNNGEICKEAKECFHVWNKKSRCENCISSKAFKSKETMSKFEFIDDNVFYVLSTYIEIEGKAYMLEMVQEMKDETLLGSFGKQEFVDTITDYTKKLYMDALTGAFNRNYYEEQLDHLDKYQAIAMIDADNFKQVNDTFGHQAGDLALQRIAKAIRSQIRENDALIRYGGDEFVLIFRTIPAEQFAAKLEAICQEVNKQRLEEYPQMRLSISIGGYYQPDAKGESMREADAMLYKAKKRKNCVEIKYSN
ncbi:MAG: GGDEF domain-containing protein [Roseburia sp.]